MILLADGGSTSVEWCLIDRSGLIKQIFTKGANPFFRTREDVSQEIAATLVPAISGHQVLQVYFYGAGCAFPEKNDIIRQAIADHYPTATIEVGSDLLAAAKGLCGRQSGIACIIGTGSNSCFYDGSEIQANVSPLGYVLGDEGSGAVLGRLFVGACLKNQLTAGLKEQFLEEYQLTPAIILDRVYKQPLANRFLASFSRFINQHLDDEGIRNLVSQAFRDFFMKNVMQYDYHHNTVHLTGSVAFHYQELLRKVASDLGITIGKITQSPMEGMIAYYQ